MDQSTGFISNSLNFENLWDSGRFSETQLMMSTPAQQPAAILPSQPAPSLSSSNVFIPIPKMPNVKSEN